MKQRLPNLRKLAISKHIFMPDPELEYNLLDFFKLLFRTLNVPYYDDCCPLDYNTGNGNKIKEIKVGDSTITLTQEEYKIFGAVPNGIEVYLEQSNNIYEPVQVQTVFHGNPFLPKSTDYLEIILPGNAPSKGFVVYS